MEQSDLENLIADLEVAIDRLRSLYDQYFMGIEKIEPAVARKDVDRRIHAMRKEHIRNTALRFRFQMILQRYNTFQSHWQRICREIENGTYKRHVLRAEQRFGKDRQSGRPSKRPSVRSAAPDAPPPESVKPPTPAPNPIPRPKPAPGAPLSASLAAELAELDKEFAPPPAQDDAFLDQIRQTAGARAPLAAPKVESGRAQPPPPKPATLPGRGVVASPAEGSSLGPPRPAAPRAIPPPRPAPTPPPPTSPRPVAAPPPPPTSPRPMAPPATSPRPMAPPPTSPRPMAPPPTSPRPVAAPPPAPTSGPSIASSVPRPISPPLPSRLAATAKNEPAPAGVARPAPVAPPAPPATAPRDPAPVVARPPVTPTAAATRIQPPPPSARGDAGLPDTRVRQLYVEYVEAKRRQNESTAAITYDAVAQSLRASSEKLRQKHGKPVDFEVAVRDGKAVLKPVLK